jgi:hypothetical protein
MPISKERFKKGELYSVMRLEDVMEPDLGYQIKEIAKMVRRTPMRVGYKLRELEKEGKAECRRVESKIIWILTESAYLEGTVKLDKQKLRIRGRPTKEAKERAGKKKDKRVIVEKPKPRA